MSDVADRGPGWIFGPGPAGRCDDLRVGGAVPRWDPRRNRWLLWYYCRDRTFPANVTETLGSGRIGLATSIDGIAWTRVDGPMALGSVFEPSADPEDFDCTHVGVCDVTRVGDRWVMWYFGGDRQIGFRHRPTQMGYRMRPGLAMSDDGIHFARLRGAAANGAAVEFDGNVFAAWPNGVIDDGEFRLYYTTLESPGCDYVTRVARSRDGRSWQPLGPIRWLDDTPAHEARGAMTRHVLRNPLGTGRRWLMVYVALDATSALTRSICAAESDDGIAWHRLSRQPILRAGAVGSWDDGGVASPQLVPAGRELRLYYFGFAATRPDAPDKGIGLAVSRSGTLGDFERYGS